LRNYLGKEPIALIVMPASLADETVVNQNLLLRETATIGKAPVENFRVSFSRKHLSSDIFIADPQIPACPAIESLSQLLMVFLRKLTLRIQANLGAHPSKIKNAVSLLETTFESFNFHGDVARNEPTLSQGTRGRKRRDGRSSPTISRKPTGRSAGAADTN